MKKIEKISIAGISFALDNDAYASLNKYFNSLHEHYDNDPDGAEIIADIEGRIAELILNEQIYTKVVTKVLIDTIVAQLGSPEEIDDEAGGEGAGASTGSTSASSSFDASIPRRLHRSGEGKIFGGVLIGIAKFWDINVAWIRLVFLFPVILIIFSSPFHWHWFNEFAEGWATAFFVTYIVLWIALPMAKSPRQKLEARGERITPSSIRQNMQDSVHTPAGRRAASVAAELLTVIGRVVLFFVKFVMAIVGFSIMLAALGVFTGMFVMLVNPEGAVMINSHNGFEILAAFEGMSILSPTLFFELAMLCALLPLVVIGISLLSFTFGWRLRRVFYATTLGVWGLGVIFLGIVSTGNARFFHDEVSPHFEQWEEWADDDWEWHSDWDDYDDVDDDDWHDGRERSRKLRKALRDADAVNVDLNRDSLVIVVKKDGSPSDTIVVAERERPELDRDSYSDEDESEADTTEATEGESGH
jgi:phage shock protein PspC (stress-responsive transcriptional regulator)